MARRRRHDLGERARHWTARTLRFPYGTDWLFDVDRVRSWKGPTTLIDVGANVGDFTARLASKYPDCTIWSLEPVSSTFATLSARVGGYSNVRARRLALSDSDGSAVMTASAASHVNRLLSAEVAATTTERTESVTTTTLDALVRNEGIERIGLLKIDTEGHDVTVLRGATESLRAGIIDLVLTECSWNPRPDAPHVDLVEMVQHLRGEGFEVVAAYSENVGNVIRGSGHANVLFARAREG